MTSRLAAELRRRGVVRVVAFYLAGGWCAVQVASTVTEPLALPAWTTRLVVILVVLGFPVAVALSWVFDLTPHGLRRDGAEAVRRTPLTPTRLATGAALVLLLVGGGYAAFHRVRSAPIDWPLTIAVLPFVDSVATTADDYFVVGFTDDLLGNLSLNPELRVTGLSTVVRYDSLPRDIGTIARELNVAWIVDGRARREQDRIRVSAKLVQARSGRVMWHEEFDRSVADLFAIRRDIIAGITSSLRMTGSATGTFAPTGSLSAYDFYLQGRAQAQRDGAPAVETALDLFRRAITEDPAFALAYASKAAAFAKLRANFGAGHELLDSALIHAQRAVTLDSLLAAAHAALGIARYLSGDAVGAEAAYTRALELSPSLGAASLGLGNIKARAGVWDEALLHYERALAVDPVIANQALGNIATLYLVLGMTDEAERMYRNVLAIRPANVLARRGLLRVALQRQDAGGALTEAQQLVRDHPTDPAIWIDAGEAHIAAGDLESARAALLRSYELEPHAEGWNHHASVLLAFVAKSLGDHVRAEALLREFDDFARMEVARGSQNNLLHFGLACTAAIRNDVVQASHWLQQATEHGWLFYNDALSDPVLRTLQAEPSIEPVLARMKAHNFQMLERFERGRQLASQ